MLLEINPDTPEPRKIRRAVDAIERGEVIAYPTDTCYGFGCDLFNKKAIDQLYKLKGMSKDHHLAFICRDVGDVARYAVLNDFEYRILKQHLPGPYCFILDATREVPKIAQTPRKHVGVRIPRHEIALALVRELGRPIISSTACRPGSAPYIDAREINIDFKGLGMVIDGGVGGETPTTIVDLTGSAAKVTRLGAGDPQPFDGD
jgi:tRNA threonylcarbamoyl adenosine modification protein (Sua5/YciO/YrdC/YwlC family)